MKGACPVSVFFRANFWIVLLSIPIALLSYRFLGLGLANSFPDMGGHIELRRLAFITHVTASPIALALGGIQFFPGLRQRHKALHRWIGRIYGLAILLGGLAGLWIALGAEGGISAILGFSILSGLWVAFTARAVWLATNRRIAEHRRWMIRSFALTFAAVTLRLYLPFFFIIGEMSYAQASVFVAWLCWVPNLILVEWWLRRKSTRRQAAQAG